MYRVKLTPTAALMFNNLHPTIKKQLKSILKESILKELYENPYLGKGLRDELADFRSLRMKRYRAIYQIDYQNKEVIIYAIGHRRNIYTSVYRV